MLTRMDGYRLGDRGSRRFGRRARAAETRGAMIASSGSAAFIFAVHNITGEPCQRSLGAWNSVWSGWRLSQRGVFEACSPFWRDERPAHLVQMVDSTIVRAHVSAAAQTYGPPRRQAVSAS